MTHQPPALRLLLAALFIFPAPLLAQQPAPKAAKAKAEADPLAEARRQTAINLVNSLADEARNFSDPVLRARVQARAADAVWETDKARARTLFMRAWEAAEAADKEQGERRAREASRRGAPSSRDAGSVRREVLRLAAKRDSALGQEFLKRLDEANKEAAEAPDAAAAGANSSTPRINPDDPPTAMTQRLNLARQLLEDGDTERAMLFADPALYPVNTFGMNVLDMLRERDMKTADQRYMRLLARAASDPASDANTVSLLSAYALTPYLYITVRPDGNSHTRRFNSNNTPPEGFDPRVREAFLRAAAQILLRPIPPADQDQSSSGRTGAYVVATRLAPVFERYLPELAPQIRARQSALMQENTGSRNLRPDDPLFTRGLVPEPARHDRVQEAMSRLERTTDPNERDMIYFQLAMGFVEDDLARAREYASKVEDNDMRSQLMGALAFAAVESALQARRADEALRLAHSDELPTIQRVYALTEAARLLAKDQPGRAAEVLNEALAEAKKLDAGTKERAQALTAVATQLQAVDKQRAWDLMSEVVKAANAAKDFTGEEGGLIVRVQFRGGGAMTRNNDVEGFDLRNVFAALARDDVNRAVDLARGLTGEAARAAAMLSISQAVLAKPRRQGEADEQQVEVRQ